MGAAALMERSGIAVTTPNGSLHSTRVSARG